MTHAQGVVLIVFAVLQFALIAGWMITHSDDD